MKFFVQPITAGSSQKPAVVTQISLSVGPISADFFASTGSEIQFCSSEGTQTC